MQYRTVSIESIRRRTDARPRTDEALSALADSIAELGLINPIRVRRIGDDHEVTAGSHRLQACELLGWNEIPCIIVDDDDLHAELAMIDENLCRSELSPADRAKQTARRKAIYLDLHPETAHGGNLEGSGVAKFASPEIPAFATATAGLTGQSVRAVQLNAERGEKVIDEAIDLIRGTRLDTGTYLDKLKKLSPNDQVQAAKRDLATDRTRERPQGGIADRYRHSDNAPAPLAADQFNQFVKLVDEIEAIAVADLVAAAGRQRAVLGQRASGLAERMSAIMEELDR